MKKVVTVCPYCASGCKINLVVDNGKIVRAEAAQGKTNQGTLCLKGYYGWDFINDTQILTPRLKTPMIRRQRGGKLEAVSWDEALDYVATRLSAIKAKYGPDAIQTTGSSRGTGNETNYVITARTSLPAHTGYRISELPHRAAHGEVRAAYIMGEDPLQTDAELSAVHLELVIVQDIFMTKTASAADVILPSTSWGEHEGVYTAADRGFQRFFKAVEPKWDLKTDWQIISEIATRMGYPMHYNNTQEIWDELRHLCPDFYGATYEKMGELGYVMWPCRDESDADQGTSYLFKEKFDTPNGLAQFFTCDWVAPIDKLTDEYPMVLSTVREVGHYSCRSMTGNCAALAALADEPGYAQINTADAERLGIEDEELVWVNSRKGRIITRAQVSDRPNKGAVYMTYQWWIGACNELVSENLSPITKTPEYKYCAVNVERIADQRAAEQYVIDEYNKLKSRLRESAMG
ncbi:hypothetical protein XC62_09305 [Klebsiella pneumoniae]|uniref:molybdopterin-dependent oxidoreductase n=1 Tax=Klebsiella pneumoniae TaxID=573 RepID=UPI00287617F0|nr:molybdopterin-dependent oxidoreductase [Klebsiella pneumoniae]MDS1350327.1 hypothetical protein [Klebsiella pneumoniae]